MRVAEDLLGTYQHRIDALTLVPGPSGIFDVTVNDDLIYSKYATHRHAKAGEVLELFRGIIGPGVRPYGT